jgi:hypothetical protein
MIGHVQPLPPFVSSAPNREDVVIRRALGDVAGGRYVNVGPPQEPMTKSLVAAGWTGVTVEPGRTAVDVVPPVHLMIVTVERVEALLESDALGLIQPWVLLVAGSATEPAPAEPAWEHTALAAGYVFCLFDGVSRFYVAQERAEQLRAPLSYPACVRDSYVDARAEALQAERAALVEDVRRWRAEALSGWAEANTDDERRLGDGEFGLLRREIDAMRASVSWRVTAPLRAVRRRAGRL